MRRLLVALTLLIAASARADGAAAIVERWAAAIGGVEKLRAVGAIHRIADSNDDGTAGIRDEWITRGPARTPRA